MAAGVSTITIGWILSAMTSFRPTPAERLGLELKLD
jgi:hypothetical protein